MDDRPANATLPPLPAGFSLARGAALERFRSTPVPHRSDESWRRLPWRNVLPEVLSLPAPSEAPVASEAIEGAAVRVQNSSGGASMPVSGLPDGVVFRTLAEAEREAGPALARAFGRGNGVAAVESGRWSHLRRAFATSGFHLSVPPNVRVAVRLHARHLLGAVGRTVFPVTIVELGEGSELTFVEEYVSAGEGKSFVSPGTDLFLAAGASLRYVRIQEEGVEDSHLGEVRAYLDRDAKLSGLLLTPRTGISRLGIATHLQAAADARLTGVVLGRGKQHAEHHIRVEHVGRDSSSDLLFKAAVHDEARSVFTGNIHIGKAAKGSRGIQSLRNLVLSPHAKADAIPNLEIETDDVACKHAASVGGPDPEILFYLAARGIPADAAERLVVHGFVEDALRAFEADGETPLARWIEARFGGAYAALEA